MSRTDVHRPWRHLLYRSWSVELTSFRNLGCGCALCTGQYQRKLNRRRDRTRWRKDRQQMLATPASDRDTIDVSRRHPSW